MSRKLFSQKKKYFAMGFSIKRRGHNDVQIDQRQIQEPKNDIKGSLNNFQLSNIHRTKSLIEQY